MMLVEAEACGERQVRAHAHEHAAPSPVVDVEIVLHDPTFGELLPAVAGLVADGDQDAGRFARLQHGDDLVWLGAPEVRFDEFVAATFRRLHNWNVVLRRPRLQPLLKAIGDAMQHASAHRIQVSIGVEKPDHSLRLLKRLDQSVEQDPVEAAIVETDAILMVLIEGVHEKPPPTSPQQGSRPLPLLLQRRGPAGISRAKPLASQLKELESAARIGGERGRCHADEGQDVVSLVRDGHIGAGLRRRAA